MVEIIRIPKLGLSDYGDLVSWEAEDGEHVTAGDVVAIIESEKASAEVEAPTDGTLLGRYVEEGEEIEIEVGKPLAVIGDEGEEIPDISAIEDGSEVSTEGNSGKDNSSKNRATSSDDGSDVITDVKATPRAKRLATEKDVNLKQIEGTGPQDAVSEEDVQAFLKVATQTRKAMNKRWKLSKAVQRALLLQTVESSPVPAKPSQSVSARVRERNPTLWGRGK
ncbi:biotin/lipoyl-containing protein [Haladaptatus pallidirubidus]|uniref:biotin/lipoyl-containing protein n=1 Tax=Haladaptatus pallidirubidus TaxID=1008152 RepID=UPI0035EB64D6